MRLLYCAPYVKVHIILKCSYPPDSAACFFRHSTAHRLGSICASTGSCQSKPPVINGGIRNPGASVGIIMRAEEAHPLWEKMVPGMTARVPCMEGPNCVQGRVGKAWSGFEKLETTTIGG
jgi:hypothetical protein